MVGTAWQRALAFLVSTPCERGPARRRRAAAVLAIALLVPVADPAAAQSPAPGGIVELATSTTARTPVAPSLPARGKFVFPAPYNTVGVRLTNADDCGGNDCVNYVGYSYWRNSNNHVGSNTMLIFLTLDRARGGGGPTLFSYDKSTDAVTVLGPLFDAANHLSWATGEGWYWSATRPTALYVNDGPRLYRYDVVTRQLETVFDASAAFGANRYIWQTHTSNDDRVHSATLRASDTYEMLGCMVYREDTRQFAFFDKQGDFDECQVDKSGRWLLIKENIDGVYGEDNLIIDLDTGAQTIFLDQQGAAGHSDNGFGYMVAADNWNPLPGAVRVWSFDAPIPGSPPQGQVVYRTTDWALDIGHVSHANAQAGVPLEQQYACGGSAVRVNVPRANEIVCFRLDTSLRVLVVAPIMTDLDAGGGDGSDYAKLPKGNLDITGQYFIWTSNAGGNRLDAFVVRVPSQKLLAAPPPDTTAPVVSLAAPAAGATVAGVVTISASATDDTAVAGVRFKLDGANLGPEITSAPFSMTWDSTGAANGAHTLTAVARDAAGNTATSAAVSVTVANAATAPKTAKSVTWTNLINVAANGSSLKKTGGCDGCADASAVSKDKLIGPGRLEVTVSEKTTLRYVGFGAGTTVTGSSGIAFAIAFKPGGIAEVCESGTTRVQTTYKGGDVFKIKVSNGAVSYMKNGAVIYQSALTATLPLRVQAALYSLGATLTRVMIAQ